MSYAPFTYSVEVEDGEKILKINAIKYPYLATIEDNPDVMSFVLLRLIEDPMINSIEIEQEEIISYHLNAVEILKDFASVYVKMKGITSGYYQFITHSTPLYFEYKRALNLIDKEFLRDPIKTFVEVKRLLRRVRVIAKRNDNLKAYTGPLIGLLEKFIEEFMNTKAYSLVKDFIIRYREGRDIYKRLFISEIKPKFIFLKYYSKVEEGSNIVESYKLDNDTEVLIFRKEDEIFYRYYIYPSEYKLSSEEILILNKARDILLKYQPSSSDYLYMERLRGIYGKVAESVLYRLLSERSLATSRINLLKDILLRYTLGFGVIEKLALDDRIQDIYVNPPAGLVPITVQHVDYDLCVTNVIPTKRELESWAAKLRLISGRPFDEANPVIDTEIEMDGIMLRVAGVTRPLSSQGLSFVFRRHRRKPWTLPLFIYNRTISPLGAALLSFMIYHGRTMLIAGTRGSGKTSLLGSLLLELPRKTRIITIEDTLEIPVMYMKNLGYDVLSLKVKSPFAIQSSELDAESGVRASLRLGDSALVLGEVRSKEAQVLYEAMRVGALANAVLGTIHAESPYGVYDRVVNDLGTPKTSFKATDVIVIVNPIKDPAGLKRYRRVLRITEVRKHWENDPLKERGFVDLMVYDTEKDELKLTQEIVNGDSDTLKSIASRVRFFSKSWERLWNTILLIADTKKFLVDFAIKSNNLSILEADFVVLSNEKVNSLISESIDKFGEIERDYVLSKYEKWLRERVS
ncbi:MAG: hypothetical protein BXU00_01970 [Candidatus Nanoclepta minutus]|uniref:Bacterial type II secretion system protein E domain-containing protein n=1 Tax=Candidatus Nanoclepta minutus TaxID=1940235 RepID=A0A397WMK5_9ARCH|nr:MAG: hypothetical protein BXU00_01970 [Candidatus Nanoclepta minutus]